MISQVSGEVVALSADHLDVLMGPIALSVQVPQSVSLGIAIGDTIALATTMVVREDSITLYGFADAVSRDDFLILLSVSGIGPRLALAIVSTFAPDALRSAISSGNLAALTSVSGVGKKGAERLIVELRDRLTPVAATSPTSRGSVAPHGWQDQVRAALLGLGWTARDAQSAVEAVADAEFDNGLPAADQPASTLLRTALRSLDRS